MKAIIWNVRSVNTMQTFERLITMHRQHHFEFIGILEPMQPSNKMENYRRWIGLAQEVVNVSNKIWAFIDKVFNVDILYNTTQQITLRLFQTETHVELTLTLVYAKCNVIERIELWDSLYAMASDLTVPWLMGGDFNVIWDEEEKFGGLPISLNEVDDFSHCINTCNLTDLGFKGSIYTWWNGRSEEDCIFKWLDRCLGNIEFQQTFPGVEVSHLSKIESDHCPMLLKCDTESLTIMKSFKFLNFWVQHASFKDLVKENWKADFAANHFVTFNHKLKKLKKALSTWSKATYGGIFQKIASLEEVVLVHERKFELSPTQMNRQRLHKVQAEMIKYLALEEQFWRQKAGMAWFKDGDRNTRFFHAQVNGRRKRLKLTRIQDSLGNWVEEDDQIAAEAVKFYHEQFREDTIPTNFHIIDHIPSMVTMEQNEKLNNNPTREEIKHVVFGLNGDSTGGIDGFTGLFYQSCWEIIGEDIVQMNGGYITRLNIEQAGFVKDRSIVENVLLTQDIVTDMRLRTKAGPNVVIKLDMMKAYDRLSWLFITKVLRKTGFSERFIGLVFDFVGNNWYSVLINGQPHSFFKSSRGVKQGDPLSPTLFILAAEALSRGLNSLHSNLYFGCFGMPKWSPKINHLAYADDTIIFSSSDATSLRLIMEILQVYENASGQWVNKGKSVVYIHHLVDQEVVRKVERTTGIGRQDFPFTYLGCPIFYARRKMEHYQGLLTKVLDKLQSWKGKLLSIGGRAVLITSVLQSMPIHLLSAVNPPNYVINKLHKMFAQFFWSSSVGGTSRHWASWTNLCMPYEEGGIGFRSLHDGAKALFYFAIDDNIHNVSDVGEDGRWNVERLLEVLPEEFVTYIIERVKPPVISNDLDVPFWMLRTKGNFTVKSAWDYLRRREDPRRAYCLIWVKEPNEETLTHLFYTANAARTVWNFFLNKAGIATEGLSLHQAITKCWTTPVMPRIKPILQALPSCICWELWKRRNSLKHGKVVSISRVIYQVSNTLQSLIKLRKPGLHVPHKWQDMLLVLENYTPKLKFEKVLWEFPLECWIKDNTDGASIGNPGRSSIRVCVRDEYGDVQYAAGREINEGSNNEAEAEVMVEALRVCRSLNYSNIWLQTDSLLLKNIIDGIWKPPWNIVEQVEEIRRLKERCNLRISHIFREENKLADHLANEGFKELKDATKGISVITKIKSQNILLLTDREGLLVFLEENLSFSASSTFEKAGISSQTGKMYMIMSYLTEELQMVVSMLCIQSTGRTLKGNTGISMRKIKLQAAKDFGELTQLNVQQNTRSYEVVILIDVQLHIDVDIDFDTLYALLSSSRIKLGNIILKRWVGHHTNLKYGTVCFLSM
ncbi:uncharacterized protein LOC142180675 [Nicotiana tabacum]|uniref:Uncharacterized protein LOC142180675 n=1 Tax=Nicotiana tabacum TaxID=4097 RepID=A0AC58UH58_TOBAC